MKTLVLNSDYRPLSVIDIKRAVVLEFNNSNITALSYYTKTIRSVNEDIRIPAVMVYSKYIKLQRKKYPSKRAIRIRDKNKCLYCDVDLTYENLTIDHVIPVSRFKIKSHANTWENQVCCCRKCNNKKGNRTPEEANMKLLRQPKKVEALFLLDNIPEEWKIYLP